MSATAVEAFPEGSPKNFQDLQREVIDAGRCTYCLVCFDACATEGCESVSIVGDELHYTPSECEGAGICYASCPELDSLNLALETIYRTLDSEIGHVEQATSVMARDWSLESSHTGGAIAALLRYLLHSGEIDAAVVPAEKTTFGLLLANNEEEAVTPTGYKFKKPATTRFLRDLHRSTTEPRRLALVAAPCQARMVRKMQLNNVPPSRDVKIIIGPFCYGTLSNAQWRRSLFEKALGAKGRIVRSVEVNDQVTAIFHDGTATKVPLDDLHAAFDSSCLSCLDYSNALADLSVGPAGSPEGFETILVRTERGAQALRGALEEGYLAEWASLFRVENVDEFQDRVVDGVRERTSAKVALSLRRGRTRR